MCTAMGGKKGGRATPQTADIGQNPREAHPRGGLSLPEASIIY